MKLIKKGLYLSACLMITLSMVGCTSNKENAEKNKKYDYIDLRTKKIYNQQQALLLFTTENPAGSIISVNITSKEGKYYFIVDGTDKKNNRKTYLIDAQNGKILKKQDQGILDKTKITGFIDFVPVMDINKAAEIGSKLLKNKEIYQLVGYTLYSENDQNIYKLVFTNENEKKAKYEIVYIDGVSGKQIEEADDTNNVESDKKDSKVELDKFPILEEYFKSQSK